MTEGYDDDNDDGRDKRKRPLRVKTIAAGIKLVQKEKGKQNRKWVT